jgi:hypothetical protein
VQVCSGLASQFVSFPASDSGCAATALGTFLGLDFSVGQSMPSKLHEGFSLYSFSQNPFNVKAEGISQDLNNVRGRLPVDPGFFIFFWDENVAHIGINK